MGITIKLAAYRFAFDVFEPWDPISNTFLPTVAQQGKLFRMDRFVTMYHRPTRRRYIRLVAPADIPPSGVVKRQGYDEIMLLSDTLSTEVRDKGRVYDQLRMSHLVTPPSGGLAEFYDARVTGTGDDLGPVVFDAPVPAYVDLEMQSQVNVEENVDTVSPRFLLTFSRNISPAPGDYFKVGQDWYLVYVPYADGGFHISRVNRTPPAYKEMTYKRPSGAGSYSPVTGKAALSTADRVFSGIIGREVDAGGTGHGYSRQLEVYIYKRHLGFEPAVKDRISIDGQLYTVDQVIDRREDQQWKLEVVR